ncbi:MAG: glycosyltransferase [Halanaerobium sp.]|nr:glycosyltransferase [Halanaerobium sp.]
MEELKILIRVEGGAERGIGQVIRTLTLVDGLASDYAIKTLFVLQGNDMVQRYIGSKGHDVIAEEHDNGTEQFCGLLESFKPDLIINDHGDTPARLGGIIEESTAFSLTLDDRGDGRIGYTVVINAMFQTIDSWAPNGDDVAYSGSFYMVLQPEFGKLGNKVIKEEPERLLITFGGSDPQHLTTKVLDVLQGLEKELELIVVDGPFFLNEGRLAEKVQEVRENGHKVTVLEDVTDMAGVMADVDLAISGGGITLFELAASGTPTGVICEHADQNIIADRFASLGAVINFGLGDRFAPNYFLSAIENLLADPERRENISKKGRELVDGKGRERVLQIIKAGLQED